MKNSDVGLIYCLVQKGLSQADVEAFMLNLESSREGIQGKLNAQFKPSVRVVQEVTPGTAAKPSESLEATQKSPSSKPGSRGRPPGSGPKNQKAYILRLLEKYDKPVMKENLIKRSRGITPASLASVLTTLVKSGLVEKIKDPSLGSSRLYKITETGKNYLEEIGPNSSKRA
jgi:predicted transcriptional regulator